MGKAVFICPNGHRQETRAECVGQRFSCPECQAEGEVCVLPPRWRFRAFTSNPGRDRHPALSPAGVLTLFYRVVLLFFYFLFAYYGYPVFFKTDFGKAYYLASLVLLPFCFWHISKCYKLLTVVSIFGISGLIISIFSTDLMQEAGFAVYQIVRVLCLGISFIGSVYLFFKTLFSRGMTKKEISAMQERRNKEEADRERWAWEAEQRRWAEQARAIQEGDD